MTNESVRLLITFAAGAGDGVLSEVNGRPLTRSWGNIQEAGESVDISCGVGLSLMGNAAGRTGVQSALLDDTDSRVSVRLKMLILK